MKIKDVFHEEWDSRFFNFNVAQIRRKGISKEELVSILSNLKKEKYMLVYLFTKKRLSYSLSGFDINFIYKKIIYIKKIAPMYDINLDRNIKKYESHYPTERMINLAIESGIYSRFNLDKNIAKSKFKELYEKWIINSVNKKNATGVLIREMDNKLAGMITFDKEYGYGKIGIIAVDKYYRRRKVASSLIDAAEFYLYDCACDRVKIVTQGCNKAACRLYEKKGYRVYDTEYVYHIWV